MKLSNETDERAQLKRARLRRMRLVATALLVAMGAVLVAAAFYRSRYPALDWVIAFTEAGLVGGLADWFAVTALFRHPLGLPFPHTALVPRNKDRLGAELGDFIERNFLTPENLVARLGNLDLASHGAEWLAVPANASSAAAALSDAVPRLLGAIDDTEIERLIERAVATRLAEVDFASLVGAVLDALMLDRRHQAVFEEILRGFGIWLDGNRDGLGARFGTRSKLTPEIVDAYVVNRFVDAVIDLIDEVVASPQHELRGSFDRFVAGFAGRLRTDPALRRHVDGWKEALLQRLVLDHLVAAIWRDLKRALVAPPMAMQIAESIARLARQAGEDRALLDRINQASIQAIEAALTRFSPQFATVIADVVRSWDGRDVANRIEAEVGHDLQFIRLNGTLVGGAVGLLLHAALLALGFG